MSTRTVHSYRVNATNRNLNLSHLQAQREVVDAVEEGVVFEHGSEFVLGDIADVGECGGRGIVGDVGEGGYRWGSHVTLAVVHRIAKAGEGSARGKRYQRVIGGTFYISIYAL